MGAIADLSDEELERNCIRPGPGEFLESSTVGGVLFVIALVAAITVAGETIAAAGLFVLFFVVQVIFVWWLSGLRSRPYRVELRRRRRLAPMDAWLAEERKRWAERDRPACSVLVSLAALPHGGRRRASVCFWRDPARAVLDYRVASASHDPPMSLHRAEVEIPPQAVASLLALAADAPSIGTAPIGKVVIDGAPVDLVVLGSGAVVARVSFNLAGLSPSDKDRLPVKLVEAVLEAAEQHSPSGAALVWGTTTWAGEIKMGSA